MNRHNLLAADHPFLQRLPWLLRACGVVGVILCIHSWLPGCGTTPGSGSNLLPGGENSISVLYDEEPASQEKQAHKEPTGAGKEPVTPGKEPTVSEPPVSREAPVTPDSGVLPEKPEKEAPTTCCDTSEPPPERRQPPEGTTSFKSWIGGPCNKTSDCNYAKAVCLLATNGYPGGSCSYPCTRLCPDLTGKAQTFCVDLKGKIAGNGGCISRCDYTLFPQGGCRKGYYCTQGTRFNEPNKKTNVCLPGSAPTPTGTCYKKLQQMGVQFIKRSNPRSKPKGYPNLTCSVVDALSLQPPVLGVDWVSGSNKRIGMFMRCELALAIVKLSKYLKKRGIKKVRHYGTYNCRTIRTDSGTKAVISQHGLGYAIDLAAFWDTNNQEYSIVKHWDHSTTWFNSKKQMGCWSKNFNSPQAKVLYDIGCDMWKQRIFRLILTPNYNKTHDSHFHVDFSSSGRILTTSPGYIGPQSAHEHP